jgi:hypothetical protein
MKLAREGNNCGTVIKPLQTGNDLSALELGLNGLLLRIRVYAGAGISVLASKPVSECAWKM